MLEYSIGNSKIGKDTLIINMGSATDCPSRQLGLCNIPEGKCYALKAERQYPQVLPYRRRQAIYWQKNSGSEIARDLYHVLVKRPQIKYIRFNEAGDFYGQEDYKKLSLIAHLLKDWKFYVYTARADLDYTEERPKNLVVNGSGFIVDNMFTPNLKQIPKTKTMCKCAGDCKICKLCATRKDLYIYNPMH